MYLETGIGVKVYTMRSIYDNPVKAGICRRPEEYEYSNYKECKVVETEGEEYSFIDAKEEVDCNELICVFLQENNIQKDELIYNKEKLKELIKLLKNDYGISYRIMENHTGISRETLRNIINK